MATLNPRTGLRETWNEKLKVPVVHQRSLGGLKFTGQVTAIHTVPLRSGLTLDFYARLGRADELFVTFHGAIPDGKDAYPRFERVASLRSKTEASIAFADPTLPADPAGGMRLAWYLGGHEWDPMPSILQAVARSHGKSGAKHVAFIGGSGGGFAALRASAQVPGSMAFIQDPQTRVLAYHPGPVGRYFAAMWPGQDMEVVASSHAERFDMAAHYCSHRPDNFVYYAQNSTDREHVTSHYQPFKEATAGQEGRVFSLYKGANRGHGKITPAEFDEHFAHASRQWREFRASRA